MKVIVEIPSPRDSRWKSWRKLLRAVDTTKQNGFAFQGEWLKPGRKAELEVGALLLFYDEVGSRKHHQPEVQLVRVGSDGQLETIHVAKGWSWALELRDLAAEKLRESLSDYVLNLLAEADQLRKRLEQIEQELEKHGHSRSK